MSLATYFHVPEVVIQFLINGAKAGKSVIVSGKKGVGKSTLTNILKSHSQQSAFGEHKDVVDDELNQRSAYVLLESAKKGEQVLGNVLGSSPDDGLARLAMLVSVSKGYLEPDYTIRPDINKSIDYVVHLSKASTGFNYIENIIKIKNLGLEDKTVFRQTLEINTRHIKQ